jgi:hypothetical protein
VLTLRQRYPEEREFAGVGHARAQLLNIVLTEVGQPVHQKLTPFRQMSLTPTGLKTEALRFVSQRPRKKI